jgi:diguanylate cyclase (GGDEF)-like protein
MAAFLASQLDFIVFFYGLAFILLGTTCVAISRCSGHVASWSILASFGVLHGVGEWTDLFALIIGDTLAFAIARAMLMMVSFILLLEFARVELHLPWLERTGRLIFIPPLALVALAAAIDGVTAAGGVARYALAFFGATGTSLVFVRYAKQIPASAARWALSAAAGFALYAVAAGLIVPRSGHWPADVLDYVWFVGVTGVPIQLVRGLLALWIAFSVWAMWSQERASLLSSPQYSRFQRGHFAWTLIAMSAILISGWVLTQYLGDIYKTTVQREARGDLDLLSGWLAAETTAVDRTVKLLAESPSILPALTGGTSDDRRRAQSVLALHIEAVDASVGYIMDRSGAIVADAAEDQRTVRPGANERDRAYFREAATGKTDGTISSGAAGKFVFDPQSGARDYYASYPVRAGDGSIVGLAVLKKSLVMFDAAIGAYNHPYFFVDPDGIVVLTNRRDTLFRPLWPLSAERRKALVRQYGTIGVRSVLNHEMTGATENGVEDERDFVRRLIATDSGWSLVILNPSQEIYASRVLGIVITLFMAITALIYLFSRERHAYDGVQVENRLRLQQLARDLRFQATTDPLTGAQNRLGFDQVLAAEILRSARDETPLSLVLYDVDHFKKINDTYGHPTGDRVLVQVSKLVAGFIRSIDTLVRWGGEEFAVMLPGCDAEVAQHTAEQLRRAIEQTAFDDVGTVTCSFGVAQHAYGETAEKLMALADAALYRAKLNGRNRVELASSAVEPSARLRPVA